MAADQDTVGIIETKELSEIVDRIERINQEIDERGEDRRDIYTEAKSRGFDTKALKQLIRLRQKDQNEVEEQEAILSVYKRAVGM